ncbi:MAG: D-glycero-beta-D-manno-heptose 1-phosphate adenylyltransferase [Candidatus Omnitrophica bacterium]|nr:D-glycero-beta-D-manno-heptose 1-phosphate adenylyltransferase [Candidatus Omnitrophota bacterium]
MITNKLKTLAQINRLVSVLRKRNKKIVFTNGCFDILHYGHLKYLEEAKKNGDILIVGVNTDSSVKALKGKSRPINKCRDRIALLAGLECVDYCLAFKEKTPIKIIKVIKPDILVKGSDWKKEDIVGYKFVTAYGGKVKTIKFEKGYSTTNIIKKIIDNEKKEFTSHTGCKHKSDKGRTACM